MFDSMCVGVKRCAESRLDVAGVMHRSYDGRKTRSERSEAPTFSTVVEIKDRHTWYIHDNVTKSVDSILDGRSPATMCRYSA